MGIFIDDLGRRTSCRCWLWFVTLTFRTPHFPWTRGFPMEQPEPCPEFVQHFFERMVAWIEGQVHWRVEYFKVHQFGEKGGRLHLHCGLSWPGMFEYRWKDLQEMLWKDAGFNRILPWKRDAGFYIGRYIGRDAMRSDWGFRVGSEPVHTEVEVGRHTLIPSAFSSGETRSLFDECRPTIGGWHR